MTDKVKITFWGTRGSVPCSSGAKVRFGTNTSSVEMLLPGGGRILFDAGTGIIPLGRHLAADGLLAREPVRLFLSHFHWDHIHGLPFFNPVYFEDTRLTIYGRKGVESVFTGQLLEPFSPIPHEALTASIDLVRIGGAVELDDARVEPFELNHPQGCFGYRITAGGKTIVYATDTEPDGGPLDERLVECAADADCLIMDSNNAPAEAAQRRGWGHSTWLDCARTAERAGVGRLVLFHNDPFHDDETLELKERETREHFPASIVAFDGLKLDV